MWRVGLFIYLVAFSMILQTKNVYVMIAAIGIVGACGTARVQIGYLVLVENLPSSKHALVGSTLFIFETMIGISASIYFSYAKYWF